MDHDEDEIIAFQKKLEEEEDNASQEGGNSEGEDNYGNEDGQLLDLEKIKARDDLNEKHKQQINKIDGIRRQLKKLLDKKIKLKNEEELEFDDTKIKAAIKGVEKRTEDLKKALEKQEDKLRVMLK